MLFVHVCILHVHVHDYLIIIFLHIFSHIKQSHLHPFSHKLQQNNINFHSKHIKTFSIRLKLYIPNIILSPVIIIANTSAIITTT